MRGGRICVSSDDAGCDLGFRIWVSSEEAGTGLDLGLSNCVSSDWAEVGAVVGNGFVLRSWVSSDDTGAGFGLGVNICVSSDDTGRGESGFGLGIRI